MSLMYMIAFRHRQVVFSSSEKRKEQLDKTMVGCHPSKEKK